VARYYPISPLIWSDRGVRGWDDRTKLLAFYLLTCEHRNLEGLYRLPTAYIEADLGWSGKDVARAMEVLLSEGFIQYDREAEVVFVRNALKYQAPQSKNQITGAINAVQNVPETSLMGAFIEAAETHAPEFRKALARVVDTHSNGSATP
jgi:hypothetical protein